MTNGIQIEMAELTDTSRFWAWSAKSYENIGEFAQEYNSQAKRFSQEHLCKQQIAMLDLGMEVPTSKWIFRIVK
jgi:hypothetical protein